MRRFRPALFLLLFLPASCAAPPPDSPDQADSRLDEYYPRLCETYDRLADYLQQRGGQLPHREVVRGMARCHELAGNRDAALILYKDMLYLFPEGSQEWHEVRLACARIRTNRNQPGDLGTAVDILDPATILDPFFSASNEDFIRQLEQIAAASDDPELRRRCRDLAARLGGEPPPPAP